MDIKDPETLWLVIGFFVPGFVMYEVRASLTPGLEVSDASPVWLRFLYLSLFNYAVCLPISEHFTQLVTSCPWITVLFVPALLGFVWGYGTQNDWGRRLRGALGFDFRTVHPVPRAWDYKFGLQEARFIIVTLNDGSQILGYFGTQSFASSDREDRDVYIERLFQIEDGGSWSPVADSDGILLRNSDIRAIEFRKEG